MEAEPDASTLFAIDPVRYPVRWGGLGPLAPSGRSVCGDVDPQNRTSSELIQLLGGTVERWATKYFKLDREGVNRLVVSMERGFRSGSPSRAGVYQGTLAAHAPTT